MSSSRICIILSRHPIILIFTAVIIIYVKRFIVMACYPASYLSHMNAPSHNHLALVNKHWSMHMERTADSTPLHYIQYKPIEMWAVKVIGLVSCINIVYHDLMARLEKSVVHQFDHTPTDLSNLCRFCPRVRHCLLYVCTQKQWVNPY